MAFDFSASYDELNPADDDHRFYERLALARGVRDAVDPDPAMICAWAAVLHDARRCLRAHGVLAFESRNPQARAWAGWTRAATLRVVESGGSAVEFWHETVEVDLPRVTYDTFTRDLAAGDVVVNRDVLAFRSYDTLVASLADAGFAVDAVVGDWAGGPVTADAPEIVVVARATRLPR